MKKIVFSGICMITSVIGIIAMVLVTVSASKMYGTINGSSDMSTYLHWYGMTPIFTVFCLLGLLGLCIGLWGVFEKSSSK